MRLLTLLFLSVLLITCSDDTTTGTTNQEPDTTSLDTAVVVDTVGDTTGDTTTPVIDAIDSTKVLYDAGHISFYIDTSYNDTAVTFDSRDTISAYPVGSPVALNGQLQVIGNQLCNEAGTPIQLRGMSSMGLQWDADYINPILLDTLAEDWSCDIVRIAMYVGENGYMHVGTSTDGAMKDSIDRKEWREKLDQMIYEIGQRGMYCLLDWHTLSPGDPWLQVDAGLEFWKYMAKKHANKPHVIFELFNEPNNNNNPSGHYKVKWESSFTEFDLKALAEVYIPIIRTYDTSNSLIIVGNANWSSQPEDIAAAPLTYENIMYTYHYYTDLHGYISQEKRDALLTIPVFVTEWGFDVSALDLSLAKSFIDWMSVHKISWCKWALNSGGILATFSEELPLGPYYNNYTTAGAFIREHVLYPADNFDGSAAGPFTIDTEVIGKGAITVTPSKESYDFGEEVTITATAEVGHTFFSWFYDTLLTEASFTFTVDNRSKFQAQFNESGNVIFNGHFEYGDTKWSVDPGPQSDFDVSFDSTFSFATETPMPLVRIAQLYQNEMTLPAGDYTLSFDCYATEDRLINVNIIREFGQTYPTLLDEQDIAVTATKTTYSFTFSVNSDPRLTMRDALYFEMGKYTGTLYIDNVSIKKD